MANKVLNDYQGESIRINGVCYGYVGETLLAVDTQPGDIQGAYASCLQCEGDSSSSSSGGGGGGDDDSSSSSSDPYAGDDPAIYLTLSGGGSYPRTFLGLSFDENVAQAIPPNDGGYAGTGSEKWLRSASGGDQKLYLKATSSVNFVRFFINDIATYWKGSRIGTIFAVQNDANVTFNITYSDAKSWDGNATSITDKMFGTSQIGGGGTVTPNAGAFSGVTFKWQRGPAGSGGTNPWKTTT